MDPRAISRDELQRAAVEVTSAWCRTDPAEASVAEGVITVGSPGARRRATITISPELDVTIDSGSSRRDRGLEANARARASLLRDLAEELQVPSLAAPALALNDRGAIALLVMLYLAGDGWMTRHPERLFDKADYHSGTVSCELLVATGAVRIGSVRRDGSVHRMRLTELGAEIVDAAVDAVPPHGNASDALSTLSAQVWPLTVALLSSRGLRIERAREILAGTGTPAAEQRIDELVDGGVFLRDDGWLRLAPRMLGLLARAFELTADPALPSIGTTVDAHRAQAEASLHQLLGTVHRMVADAVDSAKSNGGDFFTGYAATADVIANGLCGMWYPDLLWEGWKHACSLIASAAFAQDDYMADAARLYCAAIRDLSDVGHWEAAHMVCTVFLLGLVQSLPGRTTITEAEASEMAAVCRIAAEHANWAPRYASARALLTSAAEHPTTTAPDVSADGIQ